MPLTYRIFGFIGIMLLSPFLLADNDNDRAKALLEQGEIVSLDSLLTNIRQHGDWKILELELEQHHNQLSYEIELLDHQGRVHKLYFDAKTGQELAHH